MGIDPGGELTVLADGAAWIWAAAAVQFPKAERVLRIDELVGYFSRQMDRLG